MSKEVESVSKSRSEESPNEHDESEGESTDVQAVLDKILGSVTAPAQRSNMKGPSTLISSSRGDQSGGCTDSLLTETANVAIPLASNADSKTGGTPSISLTQIVDMCDNEDSDVDEAESAAQVEIPGTSYRVKEALAPTIKSIIEKQGDIAEDYIMKTPECRSLALENLADFIKTFQAKRFFDLTQHGIENALEFVCHFTDAGLDVGWLQQRFKDILEAKQLIKQSSVLKERRDKTDQLIKEKKRKLQVCEEQLLALQKNADSAKKELDVVQVEAEKIKSVVSNAKTKVQFFVDHPPFDGLF